MLNQYTSMILVRNEILRCVCVCACVCAYACARARACVCVFAILNIDNKMYVY
mgnify:CR=1 FL=1